MILAWLFSTTGAFAYVSDGFEGPGVGQPADAGLGWSADSGVTVSNALVNNGSKSLFLPVLASATNTTGSSSATVWTDFYTIPRPYVSDTGVAPSTDPNATAQFFVNSNGFWTTISGNGTAVCSQALASGLVYPTVTQYSVYYHVSVLHNYVSSNWSLFVNDVPIATNLPFIASGVTSHEWAQIQNLGGNATNVCWLDDFLVTNAWPAAGTANALTNAVPGTTIPISEALMAFGSVSDPRPTNLTTTASGATVNLSFGRVYSDGRSYVVLGTSDYNLGGLSSNGVLAAGAFADNTSLSGSANRQFYKLVTLSADGSVAATNDEVYAAYKQSRTPNSLFIVGVPVEYANPSDRTMGGEMGNQLKSGLAVNDILTITSNGVDYVYNLTIDGWQNTLGGDGTLTKQWGSGVGMVVQRGATGGSTSSVFAGLKQTNSVQVAVKDNTWAYLTWPNNDAAFNNGAALGCASTMGDYIYVQTNGAANFTPARFDGTTWKTRISGTGSPLVLTLQAGDGIVYKTAGGNKVFSTTGP